MGDDIAGEGADLPIALHRFCSSLRDLKPLLRGGLLPLPHSGNAAQPIENTRIFSFKRKLRRAALNSAKRRGEYARQLTML